MERNPLEKNVEKNLLKSVRNYRRGGRWDYATFYSPDHYTNNSERRDTSNDKLGVGSELSNISLIEVIEN